MRVLLVSHYLLPHVGGIEVLVDREARLLARHGHEVAVVSSAVGGPSTVCPYPDSVRVWRVPAWNVLERRFDIPWPVFGPQLLPVLWRLVRWCDLVHVHGFLFLSSVAALLLARVCRKRAILSEHAGAGWYVSPVKRCLQRVGIELVGRLSVRLAGKVQCYNGRVQALLVRLAGGRGRVEFVLNPVDEGLFGPVGEEARRAARRRLGWAPDRAKVLFVGRLTVRKGVELLLAARDRRYDLVFCGPGERGLIGAAGAGVSYLPARPRGELAVLYRAADVLALPSRSEGGLPLVAQEALQCGLPVLLAEDEGLGAYRRCAGLYWCRPEPESVRRALLGILERPPAERLGAGGGWVPLRSLLPSEREWLEALLR